MTWKFLKEVVETKQFKIHSERLKKEEKYERIRKKYEERLGDLVNSVTLPNSKLWFSVYDNHDGTYDVIAHDYEDYETEVFKRVKATSTIRFKFPIKVQKLLAYQNE